MIFSSVNQFESTKLWVKCCGLLWWETNVQIIETRNKFIHQNYRITQICKRETINSIEDWGGREQIHAVPNFALINRSQLPIIMFAQFAKLKIAFDTKCRVINYTHARILKNRAIKLVEVTLCGKREQFWYAYPKGHKTPPQREPDTKIRKPPKHLFGPNSRRRSLTINETTS